MGQPPGPLNITTSRGRWSARAVINATGTWTRPFWPIYPGQASFRGRQLHVADYVSAEEFRGLHVIVVGGGISAVGLLDEISKVTSTSWFTRRVPVWREAAFDRQAGHDAVALVEYRVRQGLPPQSVVSVTGLIWTPALRAAAARGVLDRHPMFTAIEPDGVRMADGSFLAAGHPLGHGIPGRTRTPRPVAPARTRRRHRDGRHPGRVRAPGPPRRLRAVLLHHRRQPCRPAAVAGIVKLLAAAG